MESMKKLVCIFYSGVIDSFSYRKKNDQKGSFRDFPFQKLMEVI